MITIEIKMHSKLTSAAVVTIRENTPTMHIRIDGEYTPREAEALSDMLYAAQTLHEDINETEDD